jgi:tetratricopeptide (TPR) repeat protein
MKEKAVSLLDDLLVYDPLNFTALYEKGLSEGNISMAKWHKNMQDLDNNYLEIAAHYLNLGFHEDGAVLLSSLENPKTPLIGYYLSYFQAESGNEAAALRTLQSNKEASLNYAFPYRPETEMVLMKAIGMSPKDATAYYLLGNLLYDHRPKEAMEAWQMSGKISSSIPMVPRNMAFGAFYADKDPNKAIEHITRAISLDNSNPIWYSELSKYYDESDADFKENLAILKKNLSIVKKDVTAPKTYVELLNLSGNYDEAIQFLDQHHFRTWEGGRETYWHYVDAHTLKAKELLKDKDPRKAIYHLERALEYPENLEVGKPTHDEKNAMIYYFIGEAYSQMGKNKKATEAYQKSALAENGRNMHDLLFYQAKSNEKLGQVDESQQMFRALIERALLQRNKGTNNTLVAVEEASATNNKAISNSYFLEALGNMGLGKHQQAEELLKEALRVYKNNLWAKNMVGS